MDIISYALTISQIIIGAAVTLFTLLYFSRRLTPFDRLGRFLDNVLGDDEAVVNVTEATNSLLQIGTAAGSINGILQDDELLDGFLTEIAKRGVKIFQMSMLGIKSGDSRRMAKAETLVNEGLLKGLKSLNPIIKYGLELTGLDEEIEKEPEMFQYIMHQLMEKGVLNMFSPESLAVPKGSVSGKQPTFDF